MPLERKLIAPFKSGLQTDLKPWLTPEDAVETLENAYVFRGRIKKKPGFYPCGGSLFKSRLKIDLGKSTGGGFITRPLSAYEIKPGQTFQLKDNIFTVPTWDTTDSSLTSIELLQTGNATSPVIDLSSKYITISHDSPQETLYFFPGYPVMGIARREFGLGSVLETLVFDTCFSYRFTGLEGWVQSDTKKFETSPTNFFSFADFYGDDVNETFFYVVNGNPENEISYLEEGAYSWKRFKPRLGKNGVNNYLYGGKIVKSFANRLFVFNTFEGEDNSSNPSYVPLNYPYRIRWSPIGKRALEAPNYDKETWPVLGGLGSGWLEIPTREKITAVEIIRDNLIVFCERSTWKIVLIASATDAEAKTPFAIKRISEDFGAESINGLVTIDENIVGLSAIGFFATDSVNVKKIDEKIPQDFERIEKENNGMEKVFSLRDIRNKLVYWGFPENSTFPNKMFCWNYEYDSWSVFDFSFTAMGFFSQFSALSWSKVTEIFGTWANWTTPWNSFEMQKKDIEIIAGNQQGFVFVLEGKDTTHAQELVVADMEESTQYITITNHNLQSGDWLDFQLKQSLFSKTNKSFKVTVVNKDTITVDGVKFEAGYKGGGFAVRLPRISILTKDYMFGAEQGASFQIPYVDFLFSDTTFGQVTLFPYINSSTFFQAEENVQLGTNVIEMQKEDLLTGFRQDIRWKRLFLHTHQTSLKFEITLSEKQMENLAIATSDMQLHAMLFYVNLEGRLTT